MRLFLSICILAFAFTITASGSVSPKSDGLSRTPDPSRPITLTGTITQLRTAVSGDYSGWILLDNERSNNLDVTAVLAQARALNGHQVLVRGTFVVGQFLGGQTFRQFRVISIERVR